MVNYKGVLAAVALALGCSVAGAQSSDLIVRTNNLATASSCGAILAEAARSPALSPQQKSVAWEASKRFSDRFSRNLSSISRDPDAFQAARDARRVTVGRIHALPESQRDGAVLRAANTCLDLG